MFQRTRLDEEKAIAERLRREDRQSQPEFSEELHRRICRAVRGQRLAAAPVERRPDRSRPALHWAVAAVAAACVVGVAVWSYRATRPAVGLRPDPGVEIAQQQPKVESPVAPSSDSVAGLSPMVELANQVPVGIPALVDSTMKLNNQWAYLDHDARLTVALLKNHFPFDLGSSRTAGKAAGSP